VASKAAGLALLLRIIFILANPVGGREMVAGNYFHSALLPVAYCIGIIACITCTVGNLAAYRQRNLKRMLAYSSIAHAGYMLMAGAIITAPAADVAQGISAAVAYMIVYLFMNLGAFGTVALVAWRTGEETLDGYVGMGRRSPALAVMLAIILFSLIGLPPLGGFIVKVWLLLTLWGVGSAHGQPWLYVLVIVAVVNTLLSLYYYVRVVWYMYLLDDGRPAMETPPLGGMALLGVCTLVILLTGVPLIGWLWDTSQSLASHLYLPALTGG
jgi:NADH-quinone oxidoreductase subunit N